MKVNIEPYNPDWPAQFERLRADIWPAVANVAITIEHVGSTSVPELAAKPIIDLDVVLRSRADLDRAITGLATIGYQHQGNLGIQDREAFRGGRADIRHNLYVCPSDSIGLRNHLCLREALRGSPDLRREYASLKYALAERFRDSVDHYAEGKTTFILGILASYGFGPDSLEAIRLAQPRPGAAKS